MSHHPFQLRTLFDYSGDNNNIDQINAQVWSDSGWNSLEIDNSSPGFLIFVYSFLICQHTYFHANCSERGLLLDHSEVELDLRAGEDWKIQQVNVGIDAKLRGGSPNGATIDYIEARMRQCPVSVNIHEPPEYQIELQFNQQP